MIVYHYSLTYQGDKALINDYAKKSLTVKPMLLALQKGQDWFEIFLLEEMYRARLIEEAGGFHNYVKDATEAIFEYVRQTAFANHSVSRINCVYYCASLPDAIQAAHEDWIDCGDATKEEVKILEVQVADESVFEYDRQWYDRAYEVMKQHDIATAMTCAKQYFAGNKTDAPIFEYLSAGDNRVLREVDY